MMPLRDITSLDNRPALPAGSQRPQERMKEYKLGQQLGKGAYGIVYEVTDRRDGKVHALKQMDFKITPEGVPQSVLREITIMQSASRKRHPNILRVIEVFQSPSRNDSSLQVNMILEKCDWDLYTFLRSIPKRCPDFQCRNIIKQIFKGVDFLHSNNIVHRDLKPQNILINRDQTLKLADFGLSRSYSSTSAFTTRVVTLWYRSPELLLQVEYGSGVDIWSVGCIISEIYSGEPLFPGNSESHQLKMILQKMGTPDESDWPTTSVVSIQSFEDFPGVPMTRFAIGCLRLMHNDDFRLNPALPPAAIDLITNCLRFDPCTRLTALEALKSPLLRDDGLGTAV